MESSSTKWYRNPKVLGLFAVSLWMVGFSGAAAYFVKRGKAYEDMSRHFELELEMRDLGLSKADANGLRYLASGSGNNLENALTGLRSGKLSGEDLQSEVELKSRGESPFNMGDYFGLTYDSTVKGVFFGMAVGLIFGFIDNAGLFFGMDVLEPYFPVVNWRDTPELSSKDAELQRAGMGNTFSDALGTFLAVFVGMMVLNLNDMAIEDVSLFSEFVGIIAGCLLGVYIPYGIYAKASAKTQVILLCTVLAAFLGIFVYVYFLYYLPKLKVYEEKKEQRDKLVA